jgi:endonuclease G, mitochondrial
MSMVLISVLLGCAHRPPVGLPISSEPVSVLDNPGFTVGYSEARRNPLWVSYALGPVHDSSSDSRPSFRVDARTTSRVSPQCYTHSGYDRGHGAPNDAIAERYGVEAQRATFLMSNVSPQTCGLNREPWQALEKLVSEQYARHRVLVISGPIFDAAPETIDCGVQVPVAFYKVVVRHRRVLAVVMDQSDSGRDRRLSEFTTTVDRIEALTGLDLLAGLPDRVEARLESAEPDASWDLDTVLRPTSNCPDEQSVARRIDQAGPVEPASARKAH